MSRGRRKKNSVSLSASSRTSSRLSLRWRYPASTSIWLAGSASEPLFGTAIRSMCTCLWKEAGARAIHLEMSVDVLERDSLAQHDHLDPVEELAGLLGRAGRRLVLRPRRPCVRPPGAPPPSTPRRLPRPPSCPARGRRRPARRPCPNRRDGCAAA